MLLPSAVRRSMYEIHRVLAAVVSGPAQYIGSARGPQAGGSGVLDEQFQHSYLNS